MAETWLYAYLRTKLGIMYRMTVWRQLIEIGKSYFYFAGIY